MNVIKASYEILSCPDGYDALIAAERAARTCYKSEDRVSEDSAENLVRRLLENGHHAMLEFSGDMAVKFVSNRGFTHEMVRHRLCSFAQESTRYCNYSKGKFNSRISVMTIPEGWTKIDDHEKNREARIAFNVAYHEAERNYLKLVKMGVPAEIAREVLPIGLKAEIVVKGNLREWRHIFSLRCSRKAHPRMREVMIPLLGDVHDRIPVLFDDLAERFLVP